MAEKKKVQEEVVVEDRSGEEDLGTDEIGEVPAEAIMPRKVVEIPARPSPASALRRSEMWPIGDGMWVKVRRVDLESLLRSAGRIPNPLLPQAYRVIRGGEEPLPAEYETEEDAAEAKNEYKQALDALVVAIVAEPKVVLTTEEEEADAEALWVGHLDRSTKHLLIQVAEAELSALDSFRSDLASTYVGPAGSEVRGEAE